MKLGIIGGSGLHALPQLAAAHRISQETPWGWPSDALVEGRLEGLPVVFLPRRGPHQSIAPAEINYRANIAALKARGCTAILAVSACGSFNEAIPPGMLAVPHQIVDRTWGREASFFGGGLVAHVSLADPIVTELADALLEAATSVGAPAKGGGTYLAIDGPRFATRAESRLARAQGLDVVGMTAMPEAALAREAEMAYGLAAFVTDFDSWSAETVTTGAVLDVMAANRTRSQLLVAALCARLARKPLTLPSREGWERALDHAIVTPRSAWPVEAAAHLRAIAPRLFA